MRNLKYFSFGIISLIFASCIEEKNLSTQNEEDMENAELGLSTDFSLKTERSISITATDGEGKTQKGVKMGIFASQPYTGEGIISVEPIFVGYTDASGKFEKGLDPNNAMAALNRACQLVEELGGEVVKVLFLMELEGLKGRDKIAGYDVESVIKYPGK